MGEEELVGISEAPQQPESPTQAAQSPTNAERASKHASEKGSKAERVSKHASERGSQNKEPNPERVSKHASERGSKHSKGSKERRKSQEEPQNVDRWDTGAPDNPKTLAENEALSRSRKTGERITTTADPAIPEGQVMVSGQLVNMGSNQSPKQAKQAIMHMDMNSAEWNELRVLVLKVLHKSKWKNRFRNLEINDDPLQRWSEPVIYITIQLRFHQIQKAMRRMNNYIVRCMCLNPDNEEEIALLRDKMEDKLYELRKLSEVEEPFKEIFDQTMYNLTKTQQRLDALQDGMGMSASEASVSEDCGEEAMEELKNTRKSMQYTIANL
jgi:hypothetical protein